LEHSGLVVVVELNLKLLTDPEFARLKQMGSTSLHGSKNLDALVYWVIPGCGFRSHGDQHSELKTISFTFMVRNGDRYRIGTAAQGSSGDWLHWELEKTSCHRRG